MEAEAARAAAAAAKAAAAVLATAEAMASEATEAAIPAAPPGTLCVAYAPSLRRDSTDPAAGGGSELARFVSISAMPQYRGKSVEELRAEDYASAPIYGKLGSDWAAQLQPEAAADHAAADSDAAAGGPFRKPEIPAIASAAPGISAAAPLGDVVGFSRAAEGDQQNYVTIALALPFRCFRRMIGALASLFVHWLRRSTPGPVASGPIDSVTEEAQHSCSNSEVLTSTNTTPDPGFYFSNSTVLEFGSGTVGASLKSSSSLTSLRPRRIRSVRPRHPAASAAARTRGHSLI